MYALSEMSNESVIITESILSLLSLFLLSIEFMIGPICLDIFKISLLLAGTLKVQVYEDYFIQIKLFKQKNDLLYW